MCRVQNVKCKLKSVQCIVKSVILPTVDRGVDRSLTVETPWGTKYVPGFLHSLPCKWWEAQGEEEEEKWTSEMIHFLKPTRQEQN